MQKTLQRGFTLIELLVVIAIIGILAAVVLTSLGGAQEGAQNSNIQQSLGTVASAAQLHYNETNFTYTGLCADLVGTGGTLSDLSSSIGFINDAIDGNAVETDDIACHAGTSAFAVTAPLLVDGVAGGGSSNEGFWCIDSSGFRGQIGAHTTNTTCANND